MRVRTFKRWCSDNGKGLPSGDRIPLDWFSKRNVCLTRRCCTCGSLMFTPDMLVVGSGVSFYCRECARGKAISALEGGDILEICVSVDECDEYPLGDIFSGDAHNCPPTE